MENLRSNPFSSMSFSAGVWSCSLVERRLRLELECAEIFGTARSKFGTENYKQDGKSVKICVACSNALIKFFI